MNNKEKFKLERRVYGSPIRARSYVTNIRITHENHQKATKAFFPKTMFLVQRPHSDEYKATSNINDLMETQKRIRNPSSL